MLIVVGSTSSAGLTGLYDLKEDNSITFLKTLGDENFTNATWMVPFNAGDHTMLLTTDEAKGNVRMHEIIKEGSDISVKLHLSVPSGGIGTTHLALATSGSSGEQEQKVLVASNYDSGSISLFDISLQAGSLGSATQIVDHNLYSGCTFPAHAHQCVVNDGIAHVCDLGHDTIYSYAVDSFNPSCPLSLQGEYRLPVGSGPRHMAIDRTGAWAYILNEVSSTVAAVRIDPATHLLVSVNDKSSDEADFSGRIVSTLPAGVDSKDMAGAAILLSNDGCYLYVSNRDISPATASDLARDRSSISVFAIGDSGSSLQLMQTASTRGRHPRHMILVTRNADTGDTSSTDTAVEESAGQVSQVLLVANRDSQNFAVFPVDAGTGWLVEEEVVVSVCDPLCRDPGFVMQC
eukprot:gene12849-14832_t